MIIATAFLRKGIEQKEPKKYLPNKNVFEEYAYLYDRDPVVLLEEIGSTIASFTPFEDLESEEKEDAEIKKDDRLILCLVNTENDVKLECHVYNEKEDVFFVHHDISLHHTATSLAVLDRKGEDPFAFIAGEEKNIVGYNVLVHNQFLPDLVFKGHADKVNVVKVSGKKLISGSEDKTVKTWDIERREVASSFYVESPPLFMDVGGGSVYFASKKSVRVSDLKGKKETVRIYKGKEVGPVRISGDSLFVADGSSIVGLDVRNTTAPFLSVSLHDEEINCFDISDDRYLITGSMDDRIKVYDIVEQRVIDDADVGDETLSIAVAGDGLLYAHGGLKENLSLASLENCLKKESVRRAQEEEEKKE